MGRIHGFQQLRGSLISLASQSTARLIDGGSSALPVMQTASISSLMHNFSAVTSFSSLFSQSTTTTNRAFHSTPWHHSDDDSTLAPQSTAAVISPLQQAPAPVTESQSTTKDSLYAKAILRGVAISPQKLNLFAKLLRGIHIDDALIQCKMHHKKSAKICHNVLLSAKANATNNHGLDATKLKVDEAWVGKGKYLKRTSIHGRGRSGVRHKYHSHLTIILKEEEVPKRTRVIPMMQERRRWWNLREKYTGDGNNTNDGGVDVMAMEGDEKEYMNESDFDSDFDSDEDEDDDVLETEKKVPGKESKNIHEGPRRQYWWPRNRRPPSLQKH